MLEPFRVDRAKKRAQGEADETGDSGYKTYCYQIQIVKDQDSPESRKEVVRGHVDRCEIAHLVTQGKLVIDFSRVPIKGRHYRGSSKGNSFALVNVPQFKHEWKELVGVRREIFGKKWEVAVGGRAPGAPTASDELLDNEDPSAAPQSDAKLHR